MTDEVNKSASGKHESNSSEGRGQVRLTQYSHGGGCGCKIAPSKLQQILKQVNLTFDDKRLVVGTETSDDAAVYELNPDQYLILTTDFFMPIVDDPVDFGKVAATNAISDVYAMGGTPILALALLGMPIEKLPIEAIQGIMQGGADVCRTLGFPLAGGHSIDAPEPLFGLAVAGIVAPGNLRKNCTARPGDALILGKPLGIGLMTTALKRGLLSSAQYADVLSTMTLPNRVGAVLGRRLDVHAMTDVTGFGLLGHALELVTGSGLHAQLSLSKIPFLADAVSLARRDVFPGGARRNLEGFGSQVAFDADVDEPHRLLLADPQTSGGLLVAVAPEAAHEVVELMRQDGYFHASIIGHCIEKSPQATAAEGRSALIVNL